MSSKSNRRKRVKRTTPVSVAAAALPSTGRSKSNAGWIDTKKSSNWAVLESSDEDDSNNDGAVSLWTKPGNPQKKEATPSPAKMGRTYSSTRQTTDEEEQHQVPPSDEEIDDETDLPITTNDLAGACWKCHATLKLPDSQFCLYAMHVHPLLNVPMCYCCNNEVAKLLETQKASDDACQGCATDEGDTTLFLCDDCPRGFCETCVAQANGGGKEGLKQVRQLQEEDEDAVWTCFHCEAPTALKKLQEGLAAPGSEAGKEGTIRSLEDIMDELNAVEAEKAASVQVWEDPDYVKTKREEIADEIRLEKPKLSGNKLKALIDAEMEAIDIQIREHDERLGDTASTLQEELERDHGVDIAQLYEDHFGFAKVVVSEAQSPDWKKAADEVIQQRDREEAKLTPQNISEPHFYQENFEGIEDLMTKPEDARDWDKNRGDGFRYMHTQPSEQEVAFAYQEEERVLAERQVKVLQKLDEDMDEKEMMEEDKLASQRGPDGVSRVRRDIIVSAELKPRRRKKKTPPKPPPPEPKPPPPVPQDRLDAEMEEVGPEREGQPTSAAERTNEGKEENAAEPAQRETAEPQPPPTAAAAAADTDAVVDLTDDSPFVPPAPKPGPVPVSDFKKRLSFSKGRTTHNTPTTFDNADIEDDEEGCDDKPKDEEYYCSTDPKYANSDLVLSTPETYTCSSGHRVKTIAVSTDLAEHLKPHQREAVKFMWKNGCIDLNVRTSRKEEVPGDNQVGGCVLAHSMGLGKSLAAITLIYTMLNHPSLACPKAKSLVHTVLLIVPVNVVSSFIGEFVRWTNRLEPSILVFDLGAHERKSRPAVIRDWYLRGGVALVSKESFQTTVKDFPELTNPGPDAVFLDEAHLALSSRNSAISKALHKLKTKRRFLLTGTPVQNNVLEYFRMVNWMRPGVLDDTEAAFERKFAKPISLGMPSDATQAAKLESDLKSAQLNSILKPYVHRKDATVLLESLPALQQAVIHLRQSKMQTNMHKYLKRYEDRHAITNYFTRYMHARPIHNHPASVLMKSKDPELDADGKAGAAPWFQDFVAKVGEEKVMAVTNGPKCVMLLHILAEAMSIGDKVLCFSQCLKTLDYIEHVLQRKCWVEHVKSLKKVDPDRKLGGWKLGTEYLRLDGQSQSGDRGAMIKKFNKEIDEYSERAHLFLISSRAGGIGITLTAANRVVLFDSHFNPTVNMQALYRCYRFGQEKPVHAYRFLTEGTGEEKIYARSVNKNGLSLRVVDGKSFKGNFTEQELSNLTLTDNWAQCDRCEKWRMLRGEDEGDLPDKWYCEMNTNDPVNNTCDAPERNERWYHKHFNLKYVNTGALGESNAANVGEHQHALEAVNDDETPSHPNDNANKEALTKKDAILTKLLAEGTKTSALVSKYYYHDSLLDVDDKATDQDSKDSIPDGDSKPAAKDDVDDKQKAKKRKPLVTSAKGARATTEAVKNDASLSQESDIVNGTPEPSRHNTETSQTTSKKSAGAHRSTAKRSNTKSSTAKGSNPTTAAATTQASPSTSSTSVAKEARASRSSPRFKKRKEREPDHTTAVAGKRKSREGHSGPHSTTTTKVVPGVDTKKQSIVETKKESVALARGVVGRNQGRRFKPNPPPKKQKGSKPPRKPSPPPQQQKGSDKPQEVIDLLSDSDDSGEE